MTNSLLIVRFAKLSSPRVELVLAGIFIGTSPLSLPYLHPHGRYTTILDAASALDSMGKYYYYYRCIL